MTLVGAIERGHDLDLARARQGLGLAAGGQTGVEKVLGLLRTEIERDMALLGCKDIAAIGPHLVARRT